MDWFFGGTEPPPVDLLVAEGHQSVDVLIDGQAVQVDVDVLAESSGLFLQLQMTSTKDCPLEDFPGGVSVFRQIAEVLMSPDGTRRLSVTDENMLSFLEAAWLLECPRIFDKVMDSPFTQALSSRRKAELLEHLLPFTQASCPAAKAGSEHDDCTSMQVVSGDGSSPDGHVDFMRIFLVETRLWHKTEQAALQLANQLDTGDFVLGPRLVTGSLRMCCELLRLHQARASETGFLASAFQPVSAMWKNLTDMPLRTQVAWDSHLFALVCIRKRLTTEASVDAAVEGMFAEDAEDAEARADIPEELCASVEDDVLLGLGELAGYVQIQRASPNWMALLVRTLILNDRLSDAQAAFASSFARSKQVQELAWKGRPNRPLVPVAWLADVAEEPEASRVLLRVLARYREMDAEEFCDILENVLLARFMPISAHCAPMIFASELVDGIVGACFDAARKARTSAGTAAVSDGRCPAHWAGQHVLQRLAGVGARLFTAAFVPQCGFLPHKWPDALSEAGGSSTARDILDAAASSPSQPREVDKLFSPEPLVIEVTGHCLWDEGLLSISLLQESMFAGRAAPPDRMLSLHYGRQVVMRHLWYGHNGTYCPIPRLEKLWELASWPLCEDAGLIREAFEYLKGASRELQASGGNWCPQHEEALFRMFGALDLCRLQAQALLSPWVPVQVHAVRLLVQQEPAELIHSDLQEEVANAKESLKSVNAQCMKLSNKLNIVEQRTVINKSQISDAIVSIEEHQRKKREAALPNRRPP